MVCDRKMSEPKVRIVVDKRELNSGVIKALEKFDVDIILQTLEVGDYVCSDRVAVERKTDSDAISSLIGIDHGKIFRQCKDLVNSYQRPLLLMECDISDLFVRNIHPAAIWGMLRSIMWNGCPIEFTYNAEGTAKKLIELAKAEQQGESKPFQVHGCKRKTTPSETMESIISSIPDVGTATARDLLKHFGSIEKVMTASLEQLDEVPGIGTTTALKIREICGGCYFGK